MIGGGDIKSIFSKNNTSNLFLLFTIQLWILIILTYLVQVSYNTIWPKLVINSGGNPKSFRPLSFYESLLVVILFRCLF